MSDGTVGWLLDEVYTESRSVQPVMATGMQQAMLNMERLQDGSGKGRMRTGTESGVIRKMPMDAKKWLISRIKPSEHAYLRQLHDAGLVDFASIESVISEVVVDRFNLARQLLLLAKSATATTDIAHRRIISDCYYSQYHACRAVILFHDKVDRGDKHEDVPQQMERILPGRGLNGKLEQMISRRRCSDYDPYLRFDPAAESTPAVTETEQLLSALESFLKAKGVAL